MIGRQGAALQAAEDDQAAARGGNCHPPDPVRPRLHWPHREADQEDRRADRSQYPVSYQIEMNF